MNYTEAVDYILGAALHDEVVTRDTMKNLMAELGDPQDTLKFVHIAGTNGKGSTAAMTSSVLSAAGYKTGLYTSPYIQKFNERIQIDGVMIPDEDVAEIVTELVPAVDAIVARGIRKPTFFELVTAVGLVYFARQKCDIVVFEVGLGGRLDATNVIKVPEVAVIATIGFDHTEILGDTLELIAAEKGGIIKPGGDVVLYSQTKPVMDTISTICAERGARLHIADNENARIVSSSLHGYVFDWHQLTGLHISLLGSYQINNCVTVLKICEVLCSRGWKISEAALRAGLENAVWIGRFELLQENPVVLVDGAHNPEGVGAFMAGLRGLFGDKKLVFVMGMLADKDYMTCIDETLSQAKRFYAVTPNSSRALSSEELAADIRGEGSAAEVIPCGSIPEALDKALAEAAPDDIICAFGSLYQVGDIRRYFGK